VGPLKALSADRRRRPRPFAPSLPPGSDLRSYQLFPTCILVYPRHWSLNDRGEPPQLEEEFPLLAYSSFLLARCSSLRASVCFFLIYCSLKLPQFFFPFPLPSRKKHTMDHGSAHEGRPYVRPYLLATAAGGSAGGPMQKNQKGRMQGAATPREKIHRNQHRPPAHRQSQGDRPVNNLFTHPASKQRHQCPHMSPRAHSSPYLASAYPPPPLPPTPTTKPFLIPTLPYYRQHIASFFLFRRRLKSIIIATQPTKQTKSNYRATNLPAKTGEPTRPTHPRGVGLHSDITLHRANSGHRRLGGGVTDVTTDDMREESGRLCRRSPSAKSSFVKPESHDDRTTRAQRKTSGPRDRVWAVGLGFRLPLGLVRRLSECDGGGFPNNKRTRVGVRGERVAVGLGAGGGGGGGRLDFLLGGGCGGGVREGGGKKRGWRGESDIPHNNGVYLFLQSISVPPPQPTPPLLPPNLHPRSPLPPSLSSFPSFYSFFLFFIFSLHNPSPRPPPHSPPLPPLHRNPRTSALFSLTVPPSPLSLPSSPYRLPFFPFSPLSLVPAPSPPPLFLLFFLFFNFIFFSDYRSLIVFFYFFFFEDANLVVVGCVRFSLCSLGCYPLGPPPPAVYAGCSLSRKVEVLVCWGGYF
jgi:hypothetical protein